MQSAPLFAWKIDECAVYFDRLKLRGWGVHEPHPIVRVEIEFEGSPTRFPVAGYGQPSPDVAAAVHPSATQARFEAWVHAPAELLGHPFQLVFTLANGEERLGRDALTNGAQGDPYFQVWENFIARLDHFSEGTVLEVGSRARSAITWRHRVPAQLGYVGLDILPGPNVDVVGDAHELTALFPPGRFVAAYSLSVFEHLAMPWKVAVELNRSLAPGGLVFSMSHQSWPVHEEPWDFWRFSRHTWQTLFNPATGFEILEAVQGEPARIHACRTTTVTKGLPDSPAYLGSACIARKVAETTLSWPVPTSLAAASMYPAGELREPPTPNRP
jgi:hypothetical protein